MKNVRVRFAPSPTGGLHLGGVRTVLYNYLFARRYGGQFILRIEDTDQHRFVDGAEDYIVDCLNWCGLEPDESPQKGGPFAPYRQSQRKELYHQYALALVEEGHAYYAFDTPEELDLMRSDFKSASNSSPQYDARIRMKMKNSLTLTKSETEKLLHENIPYVIRIKMPDDEEVHFTDMIRGEVSFQTAQSDDKVLLKGDGMPTYHLAVVVDDYLMKVTHAFRGEEWLPSAPAHILLWKYLGWEKHMPQWAHLPLILKPDGHGKLSKRDGDKLGFPVFAMNWTDPKTGEVTEGFREKGFLPEAFINLLAVLGWNDGSEQEIFTLDELIAKFSIERIHKGGAKFDYEKAKWFNHEWIKRSNNERLLPDVKAIIQNTGIETKDDLLLKSSFFFQRPVQFDLEAIKGKWNEEKTSYFHELIASLQTIDTWDAPHIEALFKELALTKNSKSGELLFSLRIMLVGGKFGPPVFDIAALLGREETIARISQVLALLAT
jgi:glutamyl-tRNA synthetase